MNPKQAIYYVNDPDGNTMKTLCLDISTLPVLYSIILLLTFTGCVEHTQNLQAINRSLGEAQRTVDHANSIARQAPKTNTKALKQVGKDVLRQNPTVQEASKTVESTKVLIDSMKQLGKTTTKR